MNPMSMAEMADFQMMCFGIEQLHANPCTINMELVCKVQSTQCFCLFLLVVVIVVVAAADAVLAAKNVCTNSINIRFPWP